MTAVRRTTAVLGVIAAVAACLPAASRGAVVPVSVGRAQGRPIAPGFLGLALEYRSILPYTGDDPAAINPVLVQLIRNLVPAGRPSLRIGGLSTDRTWWPVAGTTRPLGVTYALTPRWIAAAHALAQATDARLILGLGLQANRPRLDAVEADELESGVGPDYISAFELGNEPELYTQIAWYRELHGQPVPWYEKVGTPVFSRPPGYGPAAFYGDFARALHALPGLPVAGPSTGLTPWLAGFRRFLAPGSQVKVVTWHAYGLNQCDTNPSSPYYPTVPNLLAPVASRGTLGAIAPDVARAHRVGARFRIDELGSVSCNGRLGVSNTFASALWVMDALFAIAADGVDGVNLHTYPEAANGLFDFERPGGQWQATVHPLYYGALMFARAAPAGSRLLRTDSGSQDEIRAWATRAPDHRVRVLLINDSLTSSALALVHTPVARRPAGVERLRAPSAYATGGVTLGGESFGAATPTGVLAPPRPQLLTPRDGVYRVTLPAASAALVTVPPGR